MNMHDRLDEEPETIQDLELAAEDRLTDAKGLLATGQSTGSAYLAGYVAEMVLKMATFRINGHRPDETVRHLLAPARRRAAVYGLGLEDHNYHSVLFWALLLAADRRRLGRPPPISTRVLLNRARLIHEAWSVSIRYRSGLVDVDGANKLLEQVGWMHRNRHRLWS